MGGLVPGLRAFPSWSGTTATLPSTPTGLWCWLRGQDPGDLVLMGQALQHALAPAWRLDSVVDGFDMGRGPNGHGQDLTGYEDGTETRKRDDARTAALVHEAGAGLDGGSPWLCSSGCTTGKPSTHSRRRLRTMSSVGAARTTKSLTMHRPVPMQRTAQESFDPPGSAQIHAPGRCNAIGSDVCGLRRQLPDAFEAQLHRMAGPDDGVTDALFGVHAHNRCRFWCPPLRDGRLTCGWWACERGGVVGSVHPVSGPIRWNRPAGWLLLLGPPLSALWLAAGGFPGWHLLAVFTLGTILMRSAGCCINDVADQEFDRHVKRTAQRR